MQDATSHVGRRLREIRTWRGMTLRACAELAGLSESHVSRIERGERPVDRRSTLEALAAALHVAPSELAGQPLAEQIADPVVGAAQATVTDVEQALTDVGFGDVTTKPRAWALIAVDLRRLNEELRPAADYAAQGAMLPGLIRELQSLAADSTAQREAVLIGLMNAYHNAAMMMNILGVRGLPALAAWHARRVAEELDDPAWIGLATWLRSSTLGGGNRVRMLQLSTDGMTALEPHLGDPRARQMYGALHLNAALAAAATRDPNTAAGHLAEASDVADSFDPAELGRYGFGNLYFGPNNVGIWKVALAVELGDPGHARTLAAAVDPDAVPSAARRAMYWADLGRGMASERKTRDEAIVALRRAEDIAPQRIRTNPMVRETVVDLLARARRDAVGRELRGLAFRLGLAG